MHWYLSYVISMHKVSDARVFNFNLFWWGLCDMSSDRWLKNLRSQSYNTFNFLFRHRLHLPEANCRIYIFFDISWHFRIELIRLKGPIFIRKSSSIFVGFDIKKFFVVCKTFFESCFTNSFIEFGDFFLHCWLWRNTTDF